MKQWIAKYSDRENRRDLIWHGLPIISLIVWGVFCVTNNLWYDEAYSASMVSLPWTRLLYITAVDAHSPFYYSVLKIAYLLCGGGTHYQCLKLVSLGFLFGYMLLGKYYVRKLFDQQISVYFMLFSLLMPIMTVQAGNVRMYTLALFCMTLTGLLAYDIYLNATGKKWILFCIASICTMYCHTFAMIQTFFLYLLLLGALIYSKQKEKIKPFLLCGITAVLCFSPWLVVTGLQMMLRMRYESGSITDRADIYSFVDYCKEWFSAMETPIGVVLFIGMALAVVLGYLAVDWMRANHNYAPAVGMAAVGLTTITGVLVSVYVNNCFLGRYVFPGFGFLMLFYAVGMPRLEGHKLQMGILGAAFLCFLLQYVSEIRIEYDKGLQVYEEFYEEQMSNQDVVIASETHPLFLNVYHPDLQYYVYMYKLYKLPFVNTDSFTDYAQLDNVQGKIWFLCFAGDEPWQMAEFYDYKEAVSFHFMYYDFVIYELIRK